MKRAIYILMAALPLMGNAYEANKALTLKKIRTYCKACHAVDALKFIKSEDDEELWNTIFNEKSPKSGQIWAKKMIDTLNWPTEDPPSFDAPMSSDGDWMPKGFKRLSFAEDVTDGVPTRLIILETLRKGP